MSSQRIDGGREGGKNANQPHRQVGKGGADFACVRVGRLQGGGKKSNKNGGWLGAVGAKARLGDFVTSLDGDRVGQKRSTAHHELTRVKAGCGKKCLKSGISTGRPVGRDRPQIEGA